MGVYFHFVGNWLDDSITEKQIQFRNGHIGRADMFYQAHFDQLFHLSPGFHIVFMNIRNSMGITRIHIYAWGMMIGEGPMHQIEIQIIELQIL